MDKDIDILINPKSLALFISKILSKNKGNVSKNREDLVAVLSDTIGSARKAEKLTKEAWEWYSNSTKYIRVPR